MLNIPSYIDDPSYRYKMPRLITKVEGKGNGIKTNLVNLIEAAKALRVPVQCSVYIIYIYIYIIYIYRSIEVPGGRARGTDRPEGEIQLVHSKREA